MVQHHDCRVGTGAVRALIPTSLVLFALVGSPVRAQQTIFNHPSADVLDRGQVYLELDASQRFHLGFEGLVVRGVWGPVAPLEVGINLGPLLGNGSGGEVTAAPNAKVRLFSAATDAGEVSAFTGSRLYIPLSFGSAAIEGYASLAYRTPFGLRITAGVYGQALFNAGWTGKIGATGTAEMVLCDHLTVALEWWQDRDLGVGVVLPIAKGVTVYAAYLFSPFGRRSDGIVAEVGLLF